MKILNFFVLAVVVSMLWTSCSKDKTTGGGTTTPVKVRMTDAPGNFQQVNVDITGVEFKVNDGTIVNLNVQAGIYNILDFVNGIDVLIASADVPSGTLSQVRLILGANNTVKVGGIVYPLSTPSAMQSGLKLSVNSTLTPDIEYTLLLDFDASQSIVRTGNGEYQLKPVIRTMSVATGGSIKGSITTTLALPAVISVTDGTNIYTTVTDVNGNFLLKAIPAGTYTVTVTPNAPYAASTIANVIVTVGNLTQLVVITY
jgi:hypothetical protein